jgi:hypothetical protein
VINCIHYDINSHEVFFLQCSFIIINWGKFKKINNLGQKQDFNGSKEISTKTR